MFTKYNFAIVYKHRFIYSEYDKTKFSDKYNKTQNNPFN